jgi:uncharacterized membrane protein YfcA
MTVWQAMLLGTAGFAAGGLAGLIGIGGGVIFTPMLFAVYGWMDVPEGIRTPLTVGTGLFCTGIAAGTSARRHFREGAVRGRMAVGVGLASAAAVGAVSWVVGTQAWYDASVFQGCFAVILLVVVVRMVSGPSGASAEASEERASSGWGAWLGTGTAAGTVAAAVGVGGGVVLVPAYSRWLRLPFHRAVGTSSATILVISTLSVGAYGLLGAGLDGRPPLALGYVDVGTGLLLAGPAVLGAQGGAALAHRVETHWLRWGFAALAVVVAGRLLGGAFGVL